MIRISESIAKAGLVGKKFIRELLPKKPLSAETLAGYKSADPLNLEIRASRIYARNKEVLLRDGRYKISFTPEQLVRDSYSVFNSDLSLFNTAVTKLKHESDENILLTGYALNILRTKDDRIKRIGDIVSLAVFCGFWRNELPTVNQQLRNFAAMSDEKLRLDFLKQLSDKFPIKTDPYNLTKSGKFIGLTVGLPGFVEAAKHFIEYPLREF